MMWELVIALSVSIPNSQNFKVELMPTQTICMESLKNFKFQENVQKNDGGITFVYCRPKQDEVIDSLKRDKNESIK